MARMILPFPAIIASKSGEPFAFTTSGTVSAYVQYRQAVPEGFIRTPLWPAKLFGSIAPPASPSAVTPR